MSESTIVPLSPEEVDDLDAAILDVFQHEWSGGAWGLATPALVYRQLDEQGRLDELDRPVKQTVQNRMSRLALAGHLENVHDSGCYRFVSDPREG